jgi:hypothetical protein
VAVAAAAVIVDGKENRWEGRRQEEWNYNCFLGQAEKKEANLVN